MSIPNNPITPMGYGAYMTPATFNTRYVEIDENFEDMDSRVTALEGKAIAVRGTANFAGAIGQSFALPDELTGRAYNVVVTPTQDPADVGRIWVEQDTGSFVVKNSGTGTTQFQYTIFSSLSA